MREYARYLAESSPTVIARANTFKHDREPAGPLHNAAPSTRRSRDSTHIARDVYAASAHHR